MYTGASALRVRCSPAPGGNRKRKFSYSARFPYGQQAKKGGRAPLASLAPRAPLFCLLAVRGNEQNEKLSFSVAPRRLFSENSVVETLEGSRVAKGRSEPSEPAQCAEEPMWAGAPQANPDPRSAKALKNRRTLKKSSQKALKKARRTPQKLSKSSQKLPKALKTLSKALKKLSKKLDERIKSSQKALKSSQNALKSSKNSSQR